MCASVVCLQGWDKTYCLQFVEQDFDEIHFFGDKTFPVSAWQVHTAHVCVQLVVFYAVCLCQWCIGWLLTDSLWILTGDG
jgi:hypothetical protein